MKTLIITIVIACLGLAGCVQPSYDKPVKVILTVSGKKNIETVGIRGKGKPLSWKEDLPLKVVIPDSVYEGTFTIHTGYKFLEAKFVVDEAFELENADNRRINFAEKDTTIYLATFGKIK